MSNDIVNKTLNKIRNPFMADDVIDIRKRIEEIRNEVSSAITADSDTVIQSRPAGEIAELSVPGVTTSATVRKPSPVPLPDSEVLQDTRSALSAAASMPSFQLNVRNQGMNKVLVFLVVMQLLTNIGLIATLWIKLG